MDESIAAGDTFALSRFTQAQEDVYAAVLSELGGGRKRSHWMWFVFPQINGLGSSPAAVRFALKSREEARQYLKHPLLGARLRECAELLLAIEGRTLSDIFGYPDDLKLKSSMTLFASIAKPDSVFAKVLEKYCNGQRDEKTLQLLEGIDD